MDDLQAMDAIMTALDLLQGGTQCINQHHQVKMSEYEDVGTELGSRAGQTTTNQGQKHLPCSDEQKEKKAETSGPGTGNSLVAERHQPTGSRHQMSQQGG
ncbi:uncharacterized protein LOC124146346 isoform X2 [Haliotis rufescens]|uniref:uncharacterized protein LOC124146346 isoform X2 n=1 Tax=Haliotis rufescens TaxID=6454 RepID=UPI00201F5B67|nr:uncharacterized protein LOC124146346 isoform X2 [Haliotis rufescens]